MITSIVVYPGAIMLVGAISALFMKESKRDFATAEDLEAHPVEF